MLIKITAKEIKVNIFVGICDFEYKKKQPIIVNVQAWGEIKNHPNTIDDCLDYSKVCEFVKSWEDKKHVDLLETLMNEILKFCFNQDERIQKVEAEILKPEIFKYVKEVGISCTMTREEFNASSLDILK